MCTSHSVTLGLQPDLVGSQQRQLGAPDQPLEHQPGFLETKTTSRAQRRERHSQAGSGRMRATALLSQTGRHRQELQRAERV